MWCARPPSAGTQYVLSVHQRGISVLAAPYLFHVQCVVQDKIAQLLGEHLHDGHRARILHRVNAIMSAVNDLRATLA